MVNINNSTECLAEEKILHIAVSSNFLATSKIISKEFEKKHKSKIILSSDSTANLFTKIINGAPFDIFISADAKHPILLETKTNNKSSVYAYGKIVLWKKKSSIKKNILIKFNDLKNVSLANPKLSPYGYASDIIHKNLRIKNNKIIFGSNINQTFNFVYSDNSDAGLIALSQSIHNKLISSHIWKLPSYLYPKIEQRIIILKNNTNNDLKGKFISYIKKQKIQYIIKNSGYKIEK